MLLLLWFSLFFPTSHKISGALRYRFSSVCICLYTRRRGNAGTVRQQMMTTSAGTDLSQCYPDTLPLNLVQRATTNSRDLKPLLAGTPGDHPRCSSSLPGFEHLQQPASLITSSQAASNTSKQRCFECSLCGKRFKVSQ